MFKCEVKVKSKRNDISERLEKGLPKAMEVLMKSAQEIALNNKKGNKDKDLIKYEITNNGSSVLGKLYTNFEHAVFLEYGTGIHAEMPHIGHTKMFKYSGFWCWYAPADQVKKQYRDDQMIEINGEYFPMNAYIGDSKYVMVFSQKPKPFMRPTAFELESKAINIFAEALRNEIRK